MCKVFYVPGHTSIVDYARELAPGAWIASHSGLMLAELQIRFPGVVLGDEESFLQDQERAFATRPERTTKARYERCLSERRILECRSDAAGESFKLADLEQGNLTRIFVSWGGRYWSFIGLATLPHQLIIRRVALQAMHVAAA